MASPNTNTKILSSELSLYDQYKKESLGETVKTTKTASALAVAYEKARNAIEFRADHLIRQAAIERILQRRIFLNQKDAKIAMSLVRELLWARYLPEESVDTKKTKGIEGIIAKYRYAVSESEGRFSKWLLGLASCEIEEVLTFDPLDQIIINYTSTTLSEKLVWDEDEDSKRIQIYIAVERVFSKNSEILIAHKLLKVLFPEWRKTKSIPDANSINMFFKTLENIKTNLEYPQAQGVKIAVSKLIPPFNLIRDVVEKSPRDFIKLLGDSDEINESLEEMLLTRYSQTKDRVARASKRSIVYIFLTKMVLGLLIELPIDVLLGKINYLAISINTLFPPLLMFILNSGVSLPKVENTRMMIDMVNNYLYKEGTEKTVVKVAKGKRKVELFFNYFFTISSGVLLLGLLWVLTKIGFNPVSQVIFLFFLSVISFFAYRVRNITKDYLLTDASEDTLSTSFVDYLFLPVVRVGQWLSTQISRINVLSFIFDFIIEAPLKSFLGVLEEWLHFIRVRKEEILSGD